MPLFTPTKASAACSRGSTGSHTNTIPAFSFTLSPVSSLSLPPPVLATPTRSRPNPRISTRPSPQESPLLRNPTPIRTPIHSPMRSPFSPSGPFPRTPTTPPLKYFVSPTPGARERRREARQEPVLSPISKIIAELRDYDKRRESRIETTPEPSRKSACPECDRVKMLLPAMWCGHQVTPSRMKNGWRVVRIPGFNTGKTQTGAKADKKPRRSIRTGQAQAKPVVADKSATETTPRKCIAEPLPKPNTAGSPAIHTPFKNPDLNDKPLHWSPRMFKPEIDRHDWTWSDWSSPSQGIEDVSYRTEDSPSQDPFSHYPTWIRQRIKQILAMTPRPPSPIDSTYSLTADSVRYEEVDIASSFSSDESSRSKRSGSDSSWVELSDLPWPSDVLELWLANQKAREKRGAQGFDHHLSTISTLSGSNPDASTHSQSSDFSSLLQLYTDRDSDLKTEDFDKDYEFIMQDLLGPNYEARLAATTSTHSVSNLEASTHSQPPKLFPSPQPRIDRNRGHDTTSDSEFDRRYEIMMGNLFGPDWEARLEADNSGSGAPIPSDTNGSSAARQHFHSLQQPSSCSTEALSTAPQQLHRKTPISQHPSSLPAPQRFCAVRQLPSAPTMEPRQSSEEPSRGSEFGWKSLTCVAVAAATVGAGLAYAWLSS